MKENWTHTRKEIIEREEVSYDYISRKDVIVHPETRKAVDNYELAFGSLDIVISGTPGDWVAEITDITTGRPSSLMCEGFITFEDAEQWVLRSLTAEAVSACRTIGIIQGGWDL